MNMSKGPCYGGKVFLKRDFLFQMLFSKEALSTEFYLVGLGPPLVNISGFTFALSRRPFILCYYGMRYLICGTHLLI